MGYGTLPVPERQHRIRQRRSIAAPHFDAEHELRSLRSDSGHLSGARLRPRRHLVRARQEGLDRDRPADHGGTGACSTRVVSEAHRQGAAGDCGDLLTFARRPLGRRARCRRRSGRPRGQGVDHRAARLHAEHDFRKRVRRQCDEPTAVLPVRSVAACEPVRIRRAGARPGRVGGTCGIDPTDEGGGERHRRDRCRRREDGVPEHTAHRSTVRDEHVHPVDESAVDGGERHGDAAQHLHVARRAGARSAQLVEVHRASAVSVR